MADTDVKVANEPAVEIKSEAQEAKPTTYTFGGKTYNSADDLGKAYEALQSEHGKWTQQYGDLDKKYKEASEYAQRWNSWWEGVKPLWDEEVDGLLRRKSSGGGKSQTAPADHAQAQSQTDLYEGWEALAPKDQYARLSQNISQELGQQFNQKLTQLAQAVNQTLTQKETWYQNYLNSHLGLLRKALEQKFRDPNFDIDKVMEMAAQAIGGQIDPIQLGQQLIDASSHASKLEEVKKQAYEQGKKDFEQAAANKKQESVPVFSTAVPKYKIPVTAGGPKKGLASLRETAAERIFKEFGPQWFQNP